jgi:hypothetical protein
MSDRELLELAAKAAGWTWRKSKHGYWNVTDPDGKQASCCGEWLKFDPYNGNKLAEPTPADALVEFGWNPLADDGDALRLAVKLGLTIQRGASVYVYDNPDFNDDGFTGLEICELTTKDPYAATRRAIVRAAAEIGRAMP